MTDDDEEENHLVEEDKDDDGFFTVVSKDEVLEAERTKERRKRSMDNSDPNNEAVGAKLGISFVCRICGKLHYPKSYIPDSCYETVPRFPGKYQSDDPVSDVLLNKIPDGIEDRVARLDGDFHNRRIGRDPDDVVLLADVEGTTRERFENWNRKRREIIADLVKLPIQPELTVTFTDEMQRIDDNREVVINSLLVNDKEVNTGDYMTVFYPVTKTLTTWMTRRHLHDISEDGVEVIVHVQASVEINAGRKREEAEQRLRKIFPHDLVHEHYYIRLTSWETRDCEVYEIPNHVLKLSEARKVIKTEKATRLR